MTVSNASQRRRLDTRARAAHTKQHVPLRLTNGTRGASFQPGQLAWRPARRGQA